MVLFSVIPSLATLASLLLGTIHNKLVSAAPWVKISASLPEFMDDFEVNHNTGDLASISPVTNKAYLFRHDDIVASTITAPITSGDVTLSPSEEVSVCTTPYSISYKMYQDQHNIARSYYGIVCTQVDKLFVLDAITFSLIAETPIGGLGASNIISSRNPRDPFFYYNYESGHDSTLAALDVRSMEDRGNIMVFDSSMDAAISADGRVMYSRGPWSPSGLQSIELTTTDVWNQTGSTPSFKILHDEHKSTGAYVPDTVNEKTSSGKVIYSKTLESQLASLDFDVLCWGASSSYMFGFATQGRWYDEITVTGIFAASSEDFQLVGAEAAILPDKFSVHKDSLPEIPRGVEGSSDFKRIAFRRELIANDLHSELIAAYANQLSIIPYKCFEGSSVSFVPNATYFFLGIGPQSISIDETGKQNIFASDGISLVTLPEGAIFDSMAKMLTWEPTEDQLGSHELLILAASGGRRGCYFNVTLHVSYPSMELPFNPSGISVADESSGLLVVWTSRESNYYNGNDGFCPEQSKGCLSVMSLVRVHDRQPIATKYFDFSIERIFATSDRIVVAKTKDQGTNRQTFHVFDAEDQVESLTTFVVNRETYSSSSSMTIGTRTFRIKDTNRLKDITIDLYTFEVDERELLHGTSILSSTSDGASFSTSETDPVREGVIRNGILYNAVSGEPAVLVDKGPFSLDTCSYSTYLPSWLFTIPKYTNDHRNKMAVLYEAGICLQSQVLETQHGSYNDHWKEVLIHILDLEGNFLGTKKVLEKPSGRNEHVLAAAHNHAYLAYSNMLYSFKSIDFDFSSKDSTTISMSRSNLHFAPNQTAFCVPGDDEIELHHTILGGQGPFDLFAKESQEASRLRLDAATGIVTLNGTDFMVKARDALVKYFSVKDRGVFGLLAASRKASEPLMHFNSCLNSNEVPVSKEISLQVVDQNGDTAYIIYYVFIGVPYDDIASLVTEWQQSSSAPSSTVVQPSCDCSCPSSSSIAETNNDGNVRTPSPTSKTSSTSTTTQTTPSPTSPPNIETYSPTSKTSSNSIAIQTTSSPASKTSSSPTTIQKNPSSTSTSSQSTEKPVTPELTPQPVESPSASPAAAPAPIPSPDNSRSGSNENAASKSKARSIAALVAMGLVADVLA